MKTQDYHEQILTSLEKLLSHSAEQLLTMTELLDKSESRIDRTNEAIVEMMQASRSMEKLIESIRKEYTRHINLLMTNRNKLLEQLYTAQKMVIDKDNTIKEKDAIIIEKDAIIKELYLIGIGKSTTNFNVSK